MTHDHNEDSAASAADALVAELRHRREVAGYSQKALASLVGYTASYISKVESGTILPKAPFVINADRVLNAGNAIIQRWQDLQRLSTSSRAIRRPDRADAPDDPQSAPGTDLVVKHEDATLTYKDGVFKTNVVRRLRNQGEAPVTRYLIRISVDHFPGDPDRSNAFYRANPLTWAEINLTAVCGEEPMAYESMHDRDAFKEGWLLFENHASKFPIYHGDEATIEYSYTVPEAKWGPWWQRAIRLPTDRLTVNLDFPAALDPVVWGIRTSMSAVRSPFETKIHSSTEGGRWRATWSTRNPKLHDRFRVEWKFKTTASGKANDDMDVATPGQRMASLGILQEGDEILTQPATPFDLPRESQDAHRVVTHLVATMARVSMAHDFAKGMGIAAPQVGIGRSAAVVVNTDGDRIALLNPRIVEASPETDEKYEGCLSFFDVRGMVPRPTRIKVAHQDFHGRHSVTEYLNGEARLIAHEIDHLEGRLYKSRMRDGIDVISLAEYRGTGNQWDYAGRSEEI